MQQAANTHLRKITGQKIRDAYAYLNAAGLPTGMAPYGYWREGRGLAIVPEQAEVVLRIFNLCLEGRSTYRIAELLNADGIEKPRARTAFGWLPDTVVDILRNPAYIAITGSEGRGKGKARGELIPARWEPIVPRATWDRAQELLDQRQMRRSPTGRSYAYSRLLLCATCGEALRAIRASKRHHTYYACRKDVAPRCSERWVREDGLDRWVESIFDALGALDDQAIELAREQARKAPKQGQVQSVEGVEAALGRLAQLYGWGHLTEDHYLSQRRNMESLRDELMRSEPPADLVERIRGAGRAGSEVAHSPGAACSASSSSASTPKAAGWSATWPGESIALRSKHC